MEKLISVIIPDHERKEYVRDAVNSVKSQIFDMNLVEIIVIKDYRDSEIDGFLKDAGVKSIYTDQKSLGTKLALGIENSTGSIISFLDDDDTFENMKLQRVSEVFMDGSVSFYHNSLLFASEDGKIIEETFSENIPALVKVSTSSVRKYYRLAKKYKIDWYMSAISARKSVLSPHLDFIKNTDTSLDKVIFYMCASSDGDLVFDSEKLSKYRIHSSKMNRVTGIDEFLSRREEFYAKSAGTIGRLLSYLKEGNVRESLTIEKGHADLLSYFFSDTKEHRLGTGKVVSTLFVNLYYGSFVTVKWALACLARKVYPPGVRKRIYSKTMDQFRRFGLD